MTKLNEVPNQPGWISEESVQAFREASQTDFMIVFAMKEGSGVEVVSSGKAMPENDLANLSVALNRISTEIRDKLSVGMQLNILLKALNEKIAPKEETIANDAPVESKAKNVLSPLQIKKKRP